LAPKKKPSAPAVARAALHPAPPVAASDVLPPQPVGPVVEEARPPPRRLISLKEVLRRVPLTYPTLWKMMREGRFPRPKAIGAKKDGWVEDEITAWIDNQPRRMLKGDGEA
jgi:prophage regulatory protein